MKFLILIIISGFFLAACTPEMPQENQTITISSEDLLKADLPPAEKAESLVKAAENLLMADAEFEAYQLIKEAYKLDPTSLRVQFFYYRLRSIEGEKGILVRFAPLAAKNEKTKARLEKAVAEAKQKLTEERFKFQMDGEEEVDSLSKLQNVLDEQIQIAVDEIRFLQSVKDKEIKIKAIPSYTMYGSGDGGYAAYMYAYQCSVTKKADKKYEITCPPVSVRRELIFNRADFDYLIMLKIVGFASAALANTYSAEGTLEYLIETNSEEAKEEGRNFPMTSEVFESFKQDPNFGKLRSSKWFKLMREFAGEIVSGLVFLKENQGSLCQAGPLGFVGARPGYYRSFGACFSSDWGMNYQSYLDGLETALKGEHALTSYHKVLGEKPHVVNEMKFFESPVSDLRELGRLEFDACGSVIAMENKTFNGVFPNGDANEVIPYSVPVCNVKAE